MCLGIPGQVVEIVDERKKLARVDIAGVKRQVSLACLADGNRNLEDFIGDWVLIHVGFAMSRIDEKEARETLEMLEKLGEAQQEFEAMRQSAVNHE